MKSGQHLSSHSFRGDLGHAFVVAEGALALEAGTARDLMADDGVLISQRAGEDGLGRTKDTDRGDSLGAGEVHGAGVIRDEHPAGAELHDELGEPGFTHKVGVPHLRADMGG